MYGRHAVRTYKKTRRNMKKGYVKPEVKEHFIMLESMLAVSIENMGTNETPGGDNAFNAPLRRGEWGTF